MRPAARGTLLVALSAASFGAVGVLGKAALAGASVETTLALRWAVGAVVLVLLAAALGRLRAPPRERLVPLLALGAVGLALTSGLFFVALRTLDVGVTSVLLFTNPVLVAIGARALFGERLGARGLTALFLALGGVALVAGLKGRVDPAGAAFALGGAVAYAAYILGARRWAEDVDPYVAAAVIMAAGSVAFVAAGAARGALGVPTASAALAILGLGVVCGAAAIGLFLGGLPLVGAARASILSTIEPATNVLLGAVVLQERLAPQQLVGAILVGAAAVLVATRALEPKPLA